MSDDIVTRLREGEDPLLFGDIERSDGATLIREAADEIERLRWELELAIKWRDNYKLEIEHLHERLFPKNKETEEC